MVSGTFLEYFEDIIRGGFREDAQKYLSFFNGDCGRLLMTVTIPYDLLSNMNNKHFDDYMVRFTNSINERMVRYGFELNKDYVIDVIRTE
jgi:hypothetical protein